MEVKFKRRVTNELLTTYLPSILLLCICYATTHFKAFYFEAAVTVNLTVMLVSTTLFIRLTHIFSSMLVETNNSNILIVPNSASNNWITAEISFVIVLKLHCFPRDFHKTSQLGGINIRDSWKIRRNFQHCCNLYSVFFSVMAKLPPTSYVRLIDIWLINGQLVPFLEVILLTVMELKREGVSAINHHGFARLIIDFQIYRYSGYNLLYTLFFSTPIIKRLRELYKVRIKSP